MPVITFANTKGGAGKTTAAVIIASELARLGHRVTLLDADPQQWTSRWYGLTKGQKNLSVISDVSDETIEGHIKGCKKRGGYVIVDLPGGRSPLMALPTTCLFLFRAAPWMLWAAPKFSVF